MDTLDVDVSLRLGRFELAVRESMPLNGITAVFGDSGSGKTTLLRVIAGLERAARGSIRCRGASWLDGGQALPSEARSLGMVFQDGRLFPHLDVRGNLEFPRRHGGRSGAIGFDEVVQWLGLESLLDRDTNSLSGGERQRVAIGRALLADPKLLLMDEPLSSLDRARRRELLPLIRALPERFGLPVLYVTHDIDELIWLASHVLLLADGRIAARGAPHRIFDTSEFSVIETRVSAHTAAITLADLGDQTLSVARVPVDVGQALRLRIDSRDVIVATAKPAGISIRNCLAARVRRIDAREDGLVDVRLDVGGQVLAARITPDATAELGLEPGQPVHALIKTVALGAV